MWQVRNMIYQMHCLWKAKDLVRVNTVQIPGKILAQSVGKDDNR